MSGEMQRQGEVRIDDESHIVTVRKTIRDAATRLGFGITDVTRIVTAASELARNIFHYAGTGVMRWRDIDDGSRIGIELTFEDHGWRWMKAILPAEGWAWVCRVRSG